MAQAGVSGRYFTLLCNLHLSLYDVVCGIMERVRRQASLSGDWNLMFSVFFVLYTTICRASGESNRQKNFWKTMGATGDRNTGKTEVLNEIVP